MTEVARLDASAAETRETRPQRRLRLPLIPTLVLRRLTLRIACGAKRRQVHPVVGRPAASVGQGIRRPPTRNPQDRKIGSLGAGPRVPPTVALAEPPHGTALLTRRGSCARRAILRPRGPVSQGGRSSEPARGPAVGRAAAAEVGQAGGARAKVRAALI
jgi:hypothetical protein